MKLKQWLYGVIALSLLGACSDHDVAPANGSFPDEGNGYIGVRIQLPIVPTTRANDSFDDGEPSEYKLSDAVILLFQCAQGAPSTDASCIGAYELRRSQLTADKDNDHDQITTQVARVATVTGVDLNDTDDLYALVIANGGAHDFYADGKYASWMKTEDGNGKTIQQLQETILFNDLYSQNKKGSGTASDIVMINSPFTTIKGGFDNPGEIDSALPVLVKIDNTVWPSEAEALANPAGIIHVERAVGKVTCSSFNSTTDVKVKVDGTEYALEVDEVYWDIAQDMTSSYVVRNTNRKPVDNQSGDNLWFWNYASGYCDAGAFVNPAGIYRMIGHTPIINTYYRPYFCQVPGYGVADKENYEKKTFTKTTMESKDAVLWTKDKAEKNAFYPRENTFPVDYMKYANTTRIGFWVTFKFKSTADGSYLSDEIVKGKDFYTKGLDKSIIYFDDINGYDPMTHAAIASLSENANLKTAVEAAMDKSKGGYEDLFIGDLLNFTYDDTVDDGGIVINGVQFKELDEINEKYPELFTTLPTFDFSDDIVRRLNNLENVYRYTGGKVFYEVRIKHFGDDLTPWNEPADHAGNIEESYGSEDTRSQNYLGRYGIVRNNWYDLNVEIITKLGDPEDPAKWDSTWPGKPDDNKDQYIAVIMRVLSWAKRTQSVTF